MCNFQLKTYKFNPLSAKPTQVHFRLRLFCVFLTKTKWKILTRVHFEILVKYIT
jgi:hypothetical protein